ncbi:MAG: homoserine dehydrogenase [Gammaproteobacteria bacterium]|nr:homoserine dehydrogenase [Gammaproteobacteria bacterium]
MRPIKVGLLGLGTVGVGTVKILRDNATEISRRAGCEIMVTHAVVRNIDKAKAQGFDIELSTDASTVIDNPEIDVVCEVMGGEEPAKGYILQAIANGKHVVTANKALIAIHGNEIFSLAQDKGVMVAFEAAVAGGIPVIKAIREGLAANRIQSVAGIINGTGNFIMTEMRDKGRAFADVLAEAQALGYAEADPTFDVEGIDAAHKLTILSSIAFGIPLKFEAVYTEGISKVSSDDVQYASELGYNIKHLGIARKTQRGIEMRVHPTLVPKRRLLANVDGVMNAVLVQGDAVGPTIHYGAGAGEMPTGSSVVADIVDVARTLTADPENRVPHLAFQADQIEPLPVLASHDFETGYFLRMQVEDRPGVLADITAIFGKHEISIEAVIQKEPEDHESVATLILLTREINEGAMNDALTALNGAPSVVGEVSRIRVETLA